LLLGDGGRRGRRTPARDGALNGALLRLKRRDILRRRSSRPGHGHFAGLPAARRSLDGMQDGTPIFRAYHALDIAARPPLLELQLENVLRQDGRTSDRRQGGGSGKTKYASRIHRRKPKVG
jgi:hypothetical protein